MADRSDPVAFFAIWKNKASEYRAGPEEEEATSSQIEQAFVNARAAGTLMYGRYGCRWSTGHQYFTFWICYSLEDLEKTIEELEAAGDFKFADSEHIIGSPVEDEEMLNRDILAKGGLDENCPLGFFALWRLTDSYIHASTEEREASDRAVREVFKYAAAKGVGMLGRYNCAWSTQWQYFTFWQVPSLEVLDDVMNRLEEAGDFWFADSRHIIGNLEPDFRFGTHLCINQDRTRGGY